MEGDESLCYMGKCSGLALGFFELLVLIDTFLDEDTL